MNPSFLFPSFLYFVNHRITFRNRRIAFPIDPCVKPDARMHDRRIAYIPCIRDRSRAGPSPKSGTSAQIRNSRSEKPCPSSSNFSSVPTRIDFRPALISSDELHSRETTSHQSLADRSDNYRFSASSADQTVNVLLDWCGIAPVRQLGLQPDELAFHTSDDVRQPCHHVWSTMDLEAKDTPRFQLADDLPAQS